jgi:general stress protein YciG
MGRWMLPAHIQKMFLKALLGIGLGLKRNCCACPPVTRASQCQEEYMEQERKSNRGFASMDRDKQREIARKGGRSVPNEKRSFSQNHQLASEAGRKGGHSSHGNRRASAKQRSQ